MEKSLFLFFEINTDRWSIKIQRSFFVFCSMVLLSANAYGQSVLDSYIQLGLDSNLQLQQTQMDIDKSLEGLNQAKALFKPQVDFQASYTMAQGGRQINLPVGDLLNPVYSSLNQITGTDNFPQIENVSEQFLPNHFHETKFRVIQPLFNTDVYYGYKAKAEMVSVQQAKRQVYQQESYY